MAWRKYVAAIVSIALYISVVAVIYSAHVSLLKLSVVGEPNSKFPVALQSQDFNGKEEIEILYWRCHETYAATRMWHTYKIEFTDNNSVVNTTTSSVRRVAQGGKLLTCVLPGKVELVDNSESIMLLHVSAMDDDLYVHEGWYTIALSSLTPVYYRAYRAPVLLFLSSVMAAMVVFALLLAWWLYGAKYRKKI